MVNKPRAADFIFYVKYNLNGLMLENYGAVYRAMLEMHNLNGFHLQLAIDAARRYLADMEYDIRQLSPSDIPTEEQVNGMPSLITIRSYLQKRVARLKKEIKLGVIRYENPTELTEYQHLTFLHIQEMIATVNEGVSRERAREIFDAKMKKYADMGYSCPEGTLHLIVSKLEQTDRLINFMFSEIGDWKREAMELKRTN